MREEKVFAKGFCFAKIFIFFLIGCLFGTYYEQMLWYFNNGTWIEKQGLIYGPFSPIYGIGVVVFILFLGKNNDNRGIIKTYIYSCIIGGAAECITGLLSNILFGVKFWDYTGYYLNIFGLTTIPFMMFWGLLGLILMKIIYPYISNLIEKIPYKIGMPIYYFILIFMVLNCLLTLVAFTRMTLRNEGKEPVTIIGEFCDKNYDDEFMYKNFPTMRKISS